jgi:Cu+-exporting ATPase
MTGDSAADRQTDPVCGIEVRRDSAAAKAGFEGKTYYFCAERCWRTFEAAPQKYLARRKP